MTKQQYIDYCATVARYLEGLEGVSTGPCPGCAECEDYRQHKTEEAEEDEYLADPFFSWRPCEVCGSTPGGNRQPWHAVNPATGAIVHGDCCEDCIYFLNYGRLDDTTMEGAETPAQ